MTSLFSTLSVVLLGPTTSLQRELSIDRSKLPDVSNAGSFT